MSTGASCLSDLQGSRAENKYPRGTFFFMKRKCGFFSEKIVHGALTVSLSFTFSVLSLLGIHLPPLSLPLCSSLFLPYHFHLPFHSHMIQEISRLIIIVAQIFFLSILIHDSLRQNKFCEKLFYMGRLMSSML